MGLVSTGTRYLDWGHLDRQEVCQPGNGIPEASSCRVYNQQQELVGGWKMEEDLEMEVELDPHCSRELLGGSSKGPMKTYMCTLYIWVTTH